MDTAPRHLSALQLEQGLADVLASPRDEGRLEAIVVRPASNERKLLTTAKLTPEGGIEGDRWVNDSFFKLPDGRSDPNNQLSLMNARILRQISMDDEAISLAGDNLIVDLLLSEENAPAGTRLAIGDTVLIEISDLKHTGCAKFQSRYGPEARAFVNDDRGKQLHLRGRYARIVSGGTIAVGDVVRKVGGAGG